MKTTGKMWLGEIMAIGCPLVIVARTKREAKAKLIAACRKAHIANGDAKSRWAQEELAEICIREITVGKVIWP